MKNKSVLILAAIIVIIIAVIVVLTQNKASQTAMPEKTPNSVTQKNERSMTATQSSNNENILAGTSSPLIAYNKTDYNAAISSNKLAVLYFYANWCPECREEFPKMQNVFNELKTDKVIGFRVNFNDNETENDEKELAREFGVSYQHTKVFVKNGKRILKSPESWDEARYNLEIEKYMK